MQIIITPHDIIQRCLWDKYEKYILLNKTKEEIKEVIVENKPINISEDDAYFIGLLKVIETDNLIHRFNESFVEMLHIKSTVINDSLYISKYSVEKEVSNYMSKFPDTFKAPFNYKQAIDDLKGYIDEVSISLGLLEPIVVEQRDKKFTYYLTKAVKKCLTL